MWLCVLQGYRSFVCKIPLKVVTEFVKSVHFPYFVGSLWGCKGASGKLTWRYTYYLRGNEFHCFARLCGCWNFCSNPNHKFFDCKMFCYSVHFVILKFFYNQRKGKVSMWPWTFWTTDGLEWPVRSPAPWSLSSEERWDHQHQSCQACNVFA